MFARSLSLEADSPCKIAVKEAIPFEEFRQNPNTILLTTSLGGHLCWFEPGGTRWNTRPVLTTLSKDQVHVYEHRVTDIHLGVQLPQPHGIQG